MRGSYSRVAQVLEQRHGAKHSNEFFRAMFRTPNRRCGQSLQELALDLENTVHKAYQGANEYALTVLLRDQFIDTLDIPYLRYK